MKVYKGTDKDMKCHGGFQYELGKTVEDDGAIDVGIKGSIPALFRLMCCYITAKTMAVVSLRRKRTGKLMGWAQATPTAKLHRLS